MINNRYKLEPYRGVASRFQCPGCLKRKQFTRYIDTKKGEYLASYVGRCNRQIRCGYHYTPTQFFQNNLQLPSIQQTNSKVLSSSGLHVEKKPISFIPNNIFERSLKNYEENYFAVYLQKLFAKDLTNELIKTYRIGTSKHWNGATIFWQIDSHENIKAGKIMLYDPNTGRRVKDPYNHISWTHVAVKLENFNLQQCFFGEHLLGNNLRKPVAIVESEKTAIICSVYSPQYIWLASGSLGNITPQKFLPLLGRRVFLFPDLNCYEKWKQKAVEIQRFVSSKIIISSFLEENATDVERDMGLDIADYLIKRDDKFGWALSAYEYPVFWDFP